ncbi:MAG: PEP-CTERM sorting domain-containing protein [Chthoniobacteraceae bacterium]
MRHRAVVTASILASAAALSTASAQINYSVNDSVPEMDKWMYPFASGGNGGGTRSPASTFAAVGETNFDDRDAQFFTGFRTGGTVPAGQGAENYRILSATFTLTIARQELQGEPGPGFIYDSTYDSIITYGVGGVPLNDLDPGRPLELYGAGYRNGFSSDTILENTPFASGPVQSPAKSIRNIYATDFQLGSSINGSPRDVSNNIAEGFEAVPFAIGQITDDDLDSEGMPFDDALVTFTLNLGNPDVVRYLQSSLDEGFVAFMATSLHVASQAGPSVYPTYYSDDDLSGSAPGHLQMQVQVVPEPSAVTMALCGFGLFVACWRGRRVVANLEEIV